MLQVCIDDGEHLAARRLPPADHGRGKAFLSSPPHHPQRGKPVCQPQRERPGFVGAIVVNDQQLVRPREATVQDRREPADQLGEIARFVECRDDQRELYGTRRPSGHFEGTRWNVENCGMATAFENVDRAHVPPPGCAKNLASDGTVCNPTKYAGECAGRGPHGRVVAWRAPGIELPRGVGVGGTEGGMRAIDLACAAAIVLCACAPTDQNGAGSFAPPPTRTLTLHSGGNGSGAVRSADPAFECSAQCVQNLAANANVRLTAVPASGSTFAGWQGACSGTADCSLTMDMDRDVTANFSTPPPGMARIDVVPIGKGSGRVTTSNDHLRDQGGSSEGPRPQQQPSGLVMYGDRGHMFPVQDAVLIRSWDTSGKALGDAVLRAQNFSGSPDPAGGVFLAGDLSTSIDRSAALSHTAAMYTGGGSVPTLRWGPSALASSGTVYGTGVDLLGRALVITDGRAKFGKGTISAQGFERDGGALTDEFVLVSGFSAGESTWFETSPLIGAGLAVRRMDYAYSQIGAYHAHALVLVASGQSSVQPAPDWMVARPDTRL